MSGSILGIDLNGIIDRWAMVEANGEVSFTFGNSSIPPVVIAPLSKGDKPLSGEQALKAIEGRGWVWPEEASGPDSSGLCRRLPVITLLQLILKKKKEVEVAKGEFISISQLLGSHLKELAQRQVDTAVVAIPDTADETFQQRIVDSRHEAGFEKTLLLWRPVASLLAWGQDLATSELEKLCGTQTKALVMHLDALGLEVSVLTLEVEKSNLGLLLTPVRSHIGRGPVEGHSRLLDFAQEIAETHSRRLLGDSLMWQMIWGSPFIWKGLMEHSQSTDLFQNSKGEFLTLSQPNYEMPRETVEDFIESYEDILEEFESSELAQVRHVIADGSFLGLTCANNQTMAAILRKSVLKRFGGRSSLSFHMRTDLGKDGVENNPIARGAAIYAWRLAHDLPTYYDFLPQLEINATVKDKPDFVPLLPKQTKIRGGKEFGPYTVQQPFAIPAGAPELKFFIYKEGDQFKSTVTPLKEPLPRETPVELVVRQTPGQGHAVVEIRPKQSAVFGPRVLTLNWESLCPVEKNRDEIIKELTIEAGICYPDCAPVATHEKVWAALGALGAFEGYLKNDLDPNVHIDRYKTDLTNWLSALRNKRRGSALGVREFDNKVFSVVSSDGSVPDRCDTNETFFVQSDAHESPQQLLLTAMVKLAAEFALCLDPRSNFSDRNGLIQTLFLTAAWCYSAAPENVVEYLLDRISSVGKAGIQAEAVSRCINKSDHFLRFFSILENHCDSKTYNHKWVKAITQILQFRESSAEFLSDSQALKFTLMGLIVIDKEMYTKTFKVKFLWGVQLLMLIFRYRIKRKDFLKSDSPQYGELHKCVKTVLSQALEVTKVKNSKAGKYIEECLKLLDYSGTNQLIAQELASDIVNSSESRDSDSEQETHHIGQINLEESKQAISESLRAFQEAISHKQDQPTRVFQGPASTLPKSPQLVREPWTRQKQPQLVLEPEQQTKRTASSDYKTIDIPSPEGIRIPLLRVINDMGGEIQLFDATGRIAAHFGIPPEELQHNPYSKIHSSLMHVMQSSALMLFHGKCLERSRPGFWKITASGIQMLRRFNEIANQEAKSGQSAFLLPHLPESSHQEPSIQPKSRQLLEETRLETKESPKNDCDLTDPRSRDHGIGEIPSPDRIRIPLLYTIHKLGGEIQLYEAIERIADHFGIPIKQFARNPFSTVEKRLLEATQTSANLLWSQNCLERSRPGFWKITREGIEKLRSSNKIR